MIKSNKPTLGMCMETQHQDKERFTLWALPAFQFSMSIIIVQLEVQLFTWRIRLFWAIKLIACWLWGSKRCLRAPLNRSLMTDLTHLKSFWQKIKNLGDHLKLAWLQSCLETQVKNTWKSMALKLNILQKLQKRITGIARIILTVSSEMFTLLTKF